MTKPIRVAVVAFDQISPFHLSVPCVVFGEELNPLGRYELKICSAEGDRLSTTAGYQIVIEHDITSVQESDLVIVPSWRNPDERPPQALLDGLKMAYENGARIVGLCLGAYALAEAGLLEGRKATTHWAYAQDFRSRYPSVTLNHDVLYIDDGRLTTSAGTAAGIDCCLHMLRESLGAESANRVARMLVVPPHRQGGQAQFIDQPLATGIQDSVLSELIDWVRGHLNEEHSVDRLAERVLMSRRTFTRRFRQFTGTSVTQWILNERLLLSQRLLERTHISIEQVSSQAGFGSAVTLRQHFQKSFGLSPSAWRKSFRG